MEDQPHVGPVDAHSEGVGRGDDGAGAVHELVLDAFTLGRCQTRVVDEAVSTRSLEHRRRCLRVLAAAGVDDGRALGLRKVGEGLEQARSALIVAARATNLQNEVRTVEAGNDDLGVAKRELSDDVFSNRRGRRRRERDRLRASDPIQESSDAQIVRPKIVSPNRNAVSFVHRDLQNRDARERVQETGLLQALRSDVEEVEATLAQGRPDLRHFRSCLTAVDGRCRQTLSPQGVDLILHERDQG